MRRLNGWQRLWVVLSSVILLFLAVIAFATVPSSSALVKHFGTFMALAVATSGLLYFAGLAFAWVIAGFRHPSAASIPQVAENKEPATRGDFLIRTGSDEYVAPDVVTLHQWHTEGRIPVGAKVYDPNGDDWQPAAIVLERRPNSELRRRNVSRGRLWCLLATLLFTLSAVSSSHGDFYEMLGAATAGVLMPWILVGSVILTYRLFVRRARRRTAYVFYVTSVVAAALSFMSLAGQNTPERRAQREFEAVPAFQEIEKLDPQVYSEMQKAVVAGLRSGETITTAALRARPKLRQLVDSRLTYAADAPLLDYMRINIAHLKALRARTTTDCYDVAFGVRDVQLSTYVPENDRRAELRALADVFRTVRESPVSSFNRDEAESLLTTVMADLQSTTDYDFTRLEQPATTEIEKRAACDATIAIYDRVFALPSEEAATVLRYMLSDESK